MTSGTVPVHTTRWRGFSLPELDELLRRNRPSSTIEELLCPHCGHHSLRTYLHGADRGDIPMTLTHFWCPDCRHYAGWPAPRQQGFWFSDPLAETSWSRFLSLSRSEDVFFETLDELWANTELPQQVQYH
ncbi:hypothetical protein ACFXHA_34625 [Nocardia sp. NPDC059240]|uniref:hypothetical protein n=1 Tax=Nocardia sp. NPDC059240 TaxID=3346786 RepID=UPI003693D170